MSTNEYIRGVKESRWPPFDKRVWQRNYYEHILRNDQDAHRIYRYIQDNPFHWAVDEEKPLAHPSSPPIGP